MFEPISVIAFDLDDTLWPCMPTIVRAERKLYQWLRQHYPRITERYSEQQLFEYRKQFMLSDPRYRIDLSLMRIKLLEQLANEADYDGSVVGQQGFKLFFRLRHDVVLYDDVLPAMQRLQTRYRLGSISNGNASADQTDLAPYFEYFINAADVMARKPDARLFRAFCERMQVEPAQCLYVGDDPHYDVAGGRDAGLQTVWVNRDGLDWPADLTPAQAEIGSLLELIELLESR